MVVPVRKTNPEVSYQLEYEDRKGDEPKEIRRTTSTLVAGEHVPTGTGGNLASHAHHDTVQPLQEAHSSTSATSKKQTERGNNTPTSLSAC